MGKIDKIVYSIWTKPSGGDILKNATNWYSPRAQLYCLALSVLEARKHFSEIEMITDSVGKEILEPLNLPMTIKTDLDQIDEKYKGFWALGKIYAYKAQDKPFIHLDTDAILFQGLPEFAHDAGIFVQNTEDAGWVARAYQPEVNHASKVLKKFPPLWNTVKEAYCTGIFGGNDLEFIQEYCDVALDFVTCLENKEGWDSISNKGSYCIIFEQYVLALLAHKQNKEITYYDKFMDKDRLRDMGYTHIWGAKKSKHILGRLRRRVEKDYPEEFKHLVKVIEKV